MAVFDSSDLEADSLQPAQFLPLGFNFWNGCNPPQFLPFLEEELVGTALKQTVHCWQGEQPVGNPPQKMVYRGGCVCDWSIQIAAPSFMEM